jgi:hypothetical protein
MIPASPASLKAVANVRFGSKADICGAKAHVRFTPESRHVQRTNGCLLWANSGHRQGLVDHLIGALLEL